MALVERAMSHKRRQVTRMDASQSAIAAALEQAGCRVFSIGYPCDLLVYVPNGTIRQTGILTWGQLWQWRTLECKVALKSGKPRLDKRQDSQAAFLRETHTPVVTTAAEALRAVGLA